MEINSFRFKNRVSEYAAKDSDAVRRIGERRLSDDYRFPYSIDADRIINSKSYTRYIDKTQVFSLVENDHITHRVLHVQLVSKIARTIGRFLGLNEDLIESVSLAHDIGHAPFGHDGETILSDICRDSGIKSYRHNVQSVHFLQNVEKNGKGLNLSLQTIDGILSHNGETHDTKLKPVFKRDFTEIDVIVKNLVNDIPGRYEPMTLEACVVRFSDTISYIGRDIEDAIAIGLIRRSDLPEKCTDILGSTNGTIVYRLVSDVIKNSSDKDYIAYSEKISEALKNLKVFNLERIYLNKKLKKHMDIVKLYFEVLFKKYADDIGKNRKESPVFRDFLDGMEGIYLEKHNKYEIARDFIGGMTDQYFINQIPENERPLKIRI